MGVYHVFCLLTPSPSSPSALPALLSRPPVAVGRRFPSRRPCDCRYYSSSSYTSGFIGSASHSPVLSRTLVLTSTVSVYTTLFGACVSSHLSHWPTPLLQLTADAIRHTTLRRRHYRRPLRDSTYTALIQLMPRSTRMLSRHRPSPRIHLHGAHSRDLIPAISLSFDHRICVTRY